MSTVAPDGGLAAKRPPTPVIAATAPSVTMANSLRWETRRALWVAILGPFLWKPSARGSGSFTIALPAPKLLPGGGPSRIRRLCSVCRAREVGDMLGLDRSFFRIRPFAFSVVHSRFFAGDFFLLIYPRVWSAAL